MKEQVKEASKREGKRKMEQDSKSKLAEARRSRQE
jgi:hypothetical protein